MNKDRIKELEEEVEELSIQLSDIDRKSVV